MKTAQTTTLRRGPELKAWVSFLHAHAAVCGQLNAQLERVHGLTINDYEVLLHLAQAPDRMLRRVDLAERVLLTPSGITRLLAGLERAGFVERASCPTDGRVSYAVLTEAGLAKLQAASRTHLTDIRSVFGEPFSEAELETLAELLARLRARGADGACGLEADCAVDDA